MDPVLIGEILAVVMFVAVLVTVMIGYPVAFTLAGVALMFSVVGHLLGAFDYSLLTGLASRYFGTMVSESLVAVPLFVFMGVMLERSKLAEQLLETMGLLFGRLPGGLGISVIIVGTLLAASTGIVGATVVTMGLLSLPAMLRAGYDPKLATGIICSSGTLGQIIPPSTVLIFLGDLLQGANTTAQMKKGNFAPDPVSVGDLFVGALIPGLMLVGLYMSWVVIKAIFQPQSCPPLPDAGISRAALWRRVVLVLIPPLALIVAVLGSILSGIATATESASVGGIGALILAAANRQLSLKVLREVIESTLKISSMVFIILLGASVFSLVFRGLGGEHLVEQMFNGMPGGKMGAIFTVMLVMFILGFFLDTFEIIFIVVPITAPILLAMDGVDPIWLGVMMGLNLQTSFLTPPFGFSLFYLRGVAPRSVTTAHIYKGVIPFVAIQALMMVILYAFPTIATALPKYMFAPPPIAASAPSVLDEKGVEDDLMPANENGGDAGQGKKDDLGFGGDNSGDDLMPKGGDDVNKMFK
ncbi:TRAP transporter large permease [Insolitispirillum peregrinum]|uniref:TRAP transporter large permease protein n=1 Tax=Insolitispirillum peregrinum TaxID=80876 RepID=A0A1N7IVV2_9PROT|nr:TRAP transporter large permease subunit [Insolitispirillum peregrinum]SIS41233.1 TRAP transporter, DctM subunit [Insolitispirillum peregrinum]